MDSPVRAQAGGPALIRLLARITGADAAAPPQSLSARLSQWIDWHQAVALSAALGARPASPTGSVGSHVHDDEGECERVRAALANAVASDRAFAVGGPPAPADAAFYRQRYSVLQQTMETEIGQLRGRLRGRLVRQAPHMGRLAAVDATMEQAVGRHERNLLASIPPVLAAHFERVRHASPDAPGPGGMTWLDAFRQDMRHLLLAELDLRMHPIHGLLAALRTTAPGPHAQ